jgi:hypothetical protein
MITQKEGKNYLYSTSNNFEGREISDEELKALMPF